VIFNKQYEISIEHGLIFKKWDRTLNDYIPIRLSEALFIKKSVQNLDSKVVYLVLAYWFRGTFRELEISMGELVPNELLKLTNKGVDIPFSSHKSISDFLTEQSKSAPHHELYRDVGWRFMENGELYFRHQKVYPNKVMPDATIDGENGLYKLEPQGSLGDWIKMVREKVQGNVQLEFILAAGFSAV